MAQNIAPVHIAEFHFADFNSPKLYTYNPTPKPNPNPYPRRFGIRGIEVREMKEVITSCLPRWQQWPTSACGR